MPCVEHLTEAETMRGEKYPDVALRWSADEAVLGRIYGQRFDRGVVGLEALALLLVGKVQDADPALLSTSDKQLVPGGHGEHRGPRVMTAERWGGIHKK